MQKNNLKNQKGFTLLEVLIGLVIFAIGILGVNAMQISSVTGNTKGRQISEATNAASDLMETFLALAYDDPLVDDDDGNGTAGLNDDIANSDGSDTTEYYDLFWNVAEDHPETDLKTIRVFVSGDRIQTFSLQMIKADN